MTVSKKVLQFMLRSWCPVCNFTNLNVYAMQQHLVLCNAKNREEFERPNIKVEPIEEDEAFFKETVKIKVELDGDKEPELKPKVSKLPKAAKLPKVAKVPKGSRLPKVTKIPEAPKELEAKEPDELDSEESESEEPKLPESPIKIRKVHVIKFTKSSVKENIPPPQKVSGVCTKPTKTRNHKAEKCGVCNKTFFDKSNLSRHVWTVHRRLFFRCKPCKIDFCPRTMDYKKAVQQCRALKLKHSKCVQ